MTFNTVLRFSGNAAAILFFLLLTTLSPRSALAGPAQDDSVDLYYFWSRYCPHCQEAKPFIENLPERHPWLRLYSYDLVGNKANQELFLTMAGELGESARSVPAFIFCGHMTVGYDRAETSGRQLERELLECHRRQGEKPPETAKAFDLPGLGRVHHNDYSLPVFTLIIAALDAFNPCAFFVLFFLLSLMTHHRSRARMIAVGGTFVACSGIMYFLFMAAWLNLFLLTEQLTIITALAGIVAIVFGAINIKDYFFFRRGISLSLSDSAKNKLFTRIRGLSQNGSWPAMLAATLVLAIAANSYELLCTAGLPMVFTRVLTLNELNLAQYYLYLALYNVVYVIPLLLIVAAFALTLGNRKLSEREGRLLKLLSGSMMLGLGAVLLTKPEWLSNMLVSVTVIFGAIALTALVAFIEKLRA